MFVWRERAEHLPYTGEEREEVMNEGKGMRGESGKERRRKE